MLRGANITHFTFKQLHMKLNKDESVTLILILTGVFIISYLLLKYQNCSVSVQKCPKIKLIENKSL